jgi:putative ABC transport system permease protein
MPTRPDTLLKSWLSRIANAFRPSGVDRALDEEMTFHIESRVADLVAGGMTRDRAEALARRQFGNRLRLREQSRDVKLLPWLDSLVRDVRLGARMLLKNRLVTAAAILSLSLALGACMAAFSLVDALILRPLPVHQPERLIYLTFPGTNPDLPDSDVFSDPAFVRLRDAGRGRVDLFAVAYPNRPRVTFDVATGERETVRAQFVSSDAFDRLGVGPAAGRLLTLQDDQRPGAHPVAVLSHAFWMQRFGGDPGIIGRWFVVHRPNADRQFQIIGVTEPRFSGMEPGYSTDVWLPYAMQDPSTFGQSTYRALRVIGRLKENVAVEQVQGVLQAAFTTFRREDVVNNFGPNTPPERIAHFINTPLYVRPATTGPSPLRARFQRPLWLLTAIAALMLLIAGSNVANLFLARIAAREDEMSLRLSLGAGRGRLIQQLLIETAIVAGAACLVGVMFATVAAPGVVSLLRSTDDPVLLDLRVDWRFVAVISGMTVLSSAWLGLVPALRAARVEPMTALKATGGRTSVSARAMRPFVVIQVAFSLIVLFVGGLLVQSFLKLSSVNPGFDTSDVLLVSWEAVQRMEPDQQRSALLQVLDRLRDVPGVDAVSAAEGNVLSRLGYNLPVPGSASETIEANVARVTPGFFETMKIPLIAGRTFTLDDFDAERPTVVIVNESFAKRYFGGQPAAGSRLDLRWGGPLAPHEIVGIAADTRYDLRKPPVPTIYVLIPHQSFSTLHVRVAGDLPATAARIRDAVLAATPLLRVTSVTSQAAMVDRTVVRERLLALLGGFFALVGLALTAVGLYGTLSYAVVQRTREIGIRVALGARAVGAVRSVVTDSASTTLIGAACGLAGGLYASRFVETMLFEVAPLDVSSLALPLGALLLATFVAAVVPAWRAARVDPVIALRNE